MSAADIAHALGDARREGRGWRCRCPLHQGQSLTLRDGDGGRLLAWYSGSCDHRDVPELRWRGLDVRPLITGEQVFAEPRNLDAWAPAMPALWTLGIQMTLDARASWCDLGGNRSRRN